MATLDRLSDLATVSAFLLESAIPQTRALLRMLRGTDLQRPAEICSFILDVLHEHKKLFKFHEIDHILKIYANLRNGIMDVRAQMEQAEKDESDRAARAEKERAFQIAFRSIIKFFKTSPTAGAVADLVIKAELGQKRVLTLSEMAKFRGAKEERDDKAARDLGAGSLHSPESEFTGSEIYLLFQIDGAVPAWHPAAPIQRRTAAPSSAQTLPAAGASTQTPPAAPTGRDPYEDEEDEEEKYYVTPPLGSRPSTTSLASLYNTAAQWAER